MSVSWLVGQFIEHRVQQQVGSCPGLPMPTSAIYAPMTTTQREREGRTKQHALDHVMSDFEDSSPFREDNDHLWPPPAPVLAPTLSTDDEREGASTAARSAATAEVYTRRQALPLQRRIFAFGER